MRPYILSGIIIVLFVVSSYILWASISTPGVVQPSQTQLAALLSVYAGVEQFDPRQKISLCQVQGPLPDHECSPGAVFPVTPEQVCVSGYAEKARNVSTSLKKKIYAAYGMTYPQKTGTYEMDHLIPLELGGNNDAANLFPEASEPKPGFKEKDIVENYLHAEVCAGQINLTEAQHQIADNWVAVYELLTPEDIQKVRSKYGSWAD